MEQVTGPDHRHRAGAAAVYLPVAFLGGSTGVMYRQFAMTIAISVAISALVALTLSPALCRMMLKPNHNKIFLFRWFDSAFNPSHALLAGSVRLAIRGGVIACWCSAR